MPRTWPVLIAVSVIAVATVYLAYIGKISEEVTSTIGTFTLVLITTWYALSTWKSLKMTQKQTRATRASFAPQIDASHSLGPDYFSVDLVNRGHGVATDIEIETRVYIHPLASLTPESLSGDYYVSIAHVAPSLPSGSSLGGPPGEVVNIRPKFFTDVSNKEISELDESDELYLPPNDSEDVLSYLSDYLENSSDPEYPTTVGDINELLEMIKKAQLIQHSEIIYSPTFEIRLKYSDALGTSEYQTQICSGQLDLEEDSFRQAFKNMRALSPEGGIRERIWRWLAKRSSKKISSSHWEMTPPYEETISPPVSKIDYSAELSNGSGDE